MTDIVVVSNSRAEWSPLSSVIAALPGARVVRLPEPAQIANPDQVMALALPWFTTELAGASIIILLGDRYETLAAALAATFLRIPIAHIHGGETTTGAFDDAFRHSITHLAEQSGGLHFAATEKAAHRITELTNGSQRVHLVGAPGLDGIPEGSARRERNTVVVSFHPETMAEDFGVGVCVQMLMGLRALRNDIRIVFTGVNKDPGHEKIEVLIDEFCQAHPSTRIVATLPRNAYISLLQEAKLLIGNTSSIPIEASWVGIPAVLVGTRQRGREVGDNIFQNDNDIRAAISSALLSFGGESNPPYRGGNVGVRIAEIVREFVREV